MAVCVSPAIPVHRFSNYDKYQTRTPTNVSGTYFKTSSLSYDGSAAVHEMKRGFSRFFFVFAILNFVDDHKNRFVRIVKVHAGDNVCTFSIDKLLS